ncbi:unnamed protein product [Trichogramma brassicae]|uniref:Reverse transcriptase domain-containing protein n=1 Tax=Trichogramma brassicae TaxID=86971 RepID=A0A6H5IJH8_9HYME|nr:unnamed protein product [Trichogramma brassicae]
MTKLSESLDEQQQQQQERQQQSSSANIRKTHSFAGSDVSKASSLTSSENTDTSIITTTTDGSPSLLSTEGFCEGESTDDVSPHSTLNKSSSSSSVSSRCTPTIVTTDSDNEVTMVILGSNGSNSSDKPKCIVRSESKDDGMDCNYASDEDEGDDEDEPLYENCDNAKSVVVTRTQHRVNSDDSSNNNVQLQPTRIEASSPHSNDCESSGNWYSDPDEDKINDELIRHSVYRPNSKHNSVLECVNQILLRDMEDDENVLSVPRRFKHRGKIVRFQPARLSDIESVGSEMERRNSEDTPSNLPTAPPPPPPMTITTTTQDVSSDKNIKDEDNDNETDPSNGSFEATNSEDEYGMRIIPMHALNPESGIEEDVDDTKARPIVIIEPVSDKKSIISRSSKNNSVPVTVADDNLSIKSLALSSNHDYEEIESLPDIIAPMQISVKSAKAPSLPPKPQFHSNTLILKKIPSPSFLIDETSAKKQQASERLNSVVLHPVRSLKFDNDSLMTSTSKKLAESGESAKPPTQQQRLNRPKSIEQIPAKVTSIVKHFEEFKIDNNDDCKKPVTSQIVLDNYDIQQNFEEFKLDDCDLSEGPELRDDSSSSDTYTTLSPTNNLVSSLSSDSHENNNAPLASSNGNYDSFLEATGLSNKSILTPSRMLSNHKSMLKPKDVKYKSKIKATAVMERHAPATLTRHWTGPMSIGTLEQKIVITQLTANRSGNDATSSMRNRLPYIKHIMRDQRSASINRNNATYLFSCEIIRSDIVDRSKIYFFAEVISQLRAPFPHCAQVFRAAATARLGLPPLRCPCDINDENPPYWIPENTMEVTLTEYEENLCFDLDDPDFAPICSRSTSHGVFRGVSFGGGVSINTGRQVTFGGRSRALASFSRVLRGVGCNAWVSCCARVQVSVTSGVPQGSVLGPLLYALFANDARVLKNCRHHIYADDTTIYVHGSFTDVRRLTVLLSEDLDRLAAWAADSDLVINPDKTKAIWLGTQRYVSQLRAGDISPPVIERSPVRMVDRLKLLGVTLDGELTWRDHVSVVTARLFATLSDLRRCGDFLASDVRAMLVSTLVFPHVDYCAAFFLSISAEQALRIKRCMNAVVRFFTGLSRWQHITPQYVKFNILPYEKRIQCACLGMLASVLRNGNPDNWSTEFEFREAPAGRSCRRDELELTQAPSTANLSNIAERSTQKFSDIIKTWSASSEFSASESQRSKVSPFFSFAIENLEMKFVKINMLIRILQSGFLVRWHRDVSNNKDGVSSDSKHQFVDFDLFDDMFDVFLAFRNPEDIACVPCPNSLISSWIAQIGGDDDIILVAKRHRPVRTIFRHVNYPISIMYYKKILRSRRVGLPTEQGSDRKPLLPDGQTLIPKTPAQARTRSPLLTPVRLYQSQLHLGQSQKLPLPRRTHDSSSSYRCSPPNHLTRLFS